MTEITPSNQTPFYTPAGLARKLSLSERTLRSMLERGTIPSYRIGGSRRIDPTDVAAYLKLRRSNGNGR